MWKWVTCLTIPALHSEKPQPRAANAGYTPEGASVPGLPTGCTDTQLNGNLIFQCLQSKPPNQASSLTYSIESNQRKQSLPRKTGTSPLAFVLTGSCNRRASKGSVLGHLPRQSGNVIKQNPAEHIPKPVCSVDPEELCPF